MSRLRLTIDSDLRDVSLVAMAINRICGHLGLNEVQAYHVELCITEAATNVIRHAYGGEADKSVSISVSASEDCLMIELWDSGTPMSAEQARRLTSGSEIVEVEGADLNLLKEGGRGLQIIHDLMDEVGYSREDGVNRLRLVKRFEPHKPG